MDFPHAREGCRELTHRHARRGLTGEAGDGGGAAGLDADVRRVGAHRRVHRDGHGGGVAPPGRGRAGERRDEAARLLRGEKRRLGA